MADTPTTAVVVARPARPGSRELAVWVFTVGVLAAAAGLHGMVVRHPGPGTDLYLPWPLVAVGFAVAEAALVHVRFRGEALTLSMGDVPLVIGMFVLPPGQLALARVVGTGAAFVWLRRQTGAKLVCNLALSWLGCGVAVGVWHLLLAGDPYSPRGWLAAVAGVACAELVANVAVSCVITVRTGRRMPEMFGRPLLVGEATTVANACLGLVTVDVLRADPRGAWALVVVAVVVALAERSHWRLTRRFDDLERLHEFTRGVGTSLELEAVAAEVLRRVRDLLRAEFAELQLDERLAGRELRLRYDDFGLVRVAAADPPAERLVPAGGALSASLEGDDGPFGRLLVAGRVGHVVRFQPDDAELLHALAGHAAIALHNGHLADMLREQVRENAHQATHDPLTGLANRLQIDRAVDEAVAEGSAAVLLLDLDRFKDVNDTLGHGAGDALLRQIAGRLQSLVADTGCIARLGGDEFAVVLGGVDADEALRAAQSVRAVLLSPFPLDDIAFSVDASIGIALAPEHGTTAEVLLQRADVAMYAAKAEHSGVEVYRPESDPHSSLRLALVSDLRRAAARGEMYLDYQPKVSLYDGTLRGVEALVRWRHPRHGLIPPDDFIPTAEQTGHIQALTTWVLTTALRQCRQWEDAGLDIGVSVNVSPRTPHDPAFPAQLAMLLRNEGVTAERLTLEITESALMAEPERAIAVLREVRALGVHVSLDDFGVGHSSLGYLKQLPADEVKIDKSFILAMADDPNDDAIVGAVVDLVHRLGMSVVAEGIENEGTWARLRELGCDVAQGFWIGPPVGGRETPHWLVGWQGRGVADLPAATVVPLQRAARRALPSP